MSIDFGRPTVTWRTPWTSGVVDVRTAVVLGVLVLVTVLLGLYSLTIGSFRLGLGEVVGALTGTGDDRARLLVVDWRLPRLLFALLSGIALAMAGAIFQSLTRNPLGSPDVIGFDAGSYAGASVVILLVGSTRYLDIAAGAVAGGLATAVAVYLLAYRRGVLGFRLIIVGIAVGAMLSSLTSYLMLRAGTQQAMSVAAWGAGSFSALGWEELRPFAAILACLIVLVLPLAAPLRQLELGDDSSRALGVAAERVRLAATVSGVALSALVTAAAGPIPFVALVSPQIAHRFLHRAQLALLPAAVTGAALLVAADAVAQLLTISTGLATVTVGGLYFLWLLVREYRRS